MQPRSISSSKLPDLGNGQSALLGLFTGIDLQQQCTRSQVLTIFDAIQTLKESTIGRIDRIEEPEDGVVLVRLESTDIPDSSSATLAQGKDILPNGFLQVVLTDFSRSSIDSFQDPGKRLCLRHTDNTRFTRPTSRPVIRHTGSFADFRQMLCYRAHIRS